MDKIKHIQKIINRAKTDFIPIEVIHLKDGIGVAEDKRAFHERLEKNFLTYAKAIEQIEDVLK